MLAQKLIGFQNCLHIMNFYKKISSLDGDIIEFGVFKGVSLIQWATFRDILGHSSKQKIIGFDTFDKFPKTEYEKDKSYREKFVEEAGLHSIKKNELEKNLLTQRNKKCRINSRRYNKNFTAFR